jgi:hypothetical protein
VAVAELHPAHREGAHLGALERAQQRGSSGSPSAADGHELEPHAARGERHPRVHVGRELRSGATTTSPGPNGSADAARLRPYEVLGMHATSSAPAPISAAASSRTRRQMANKLAVAQPDGLGASRRPSRRRRPRCARGAAVLALLR